MEEIVFSNIEDIGKTKIPVRIMGKGGRVSPSEKAGSSFEGLVSLGNDTNPYRVTMRKNGTKYWKKYPSAKISPTLVKITSGGNSGQTGEIVFDLNSLDQTDIVKVILDETGEVELIPVGYLEEIQSGSSSSPGSAPVTNALDPNHLIIPSDLRSRNFKIWIGDNPELSEKVQKRLFELGLRWTNATSKRVDNTEQRAIFTNDGNRLQYSSSVLNKVDFDGHRHGETEMFLSNLNLNSEGNPLSQGSSLLPPPFHQQHPNTDGNFMIWIGDLVDLTSKYRVIQRLNEILPSFAYNEPSGDSDVIHIYTDSNEIEPRSGWGMSSFNSDNKQEVTLFQLGLDPDTAKPLSTQPGTQPAAPGSTNALDPGKLLEKDDFKGKEYKIWFGVDADLSEKIQRRLFALGVNWELDPEVVRNTKYPCLFIIDGFIRTGNVNETKETFDAETETEIFLSNLNLNSEGNPLASTTKRTVEWGMIDAPSIAYHEMIGLVIDEYIKDRVDWFIVQFKNLPKAEHFPKNNVDIVKPAYKSGDRVLITHHSIHEGEEATVIGVTTNPSDKMFIFQVRLDSGKFLDLKPTQVDVAPGATSALTAAQKIDTKKGLKPMFEVGETVGVNNSTKPGKVLEVTTNATSSGFIFHVELEDGQKFWYEPNDMFPIIQTAAQKIDSKRGLGAALKRAVKEEFGFEISTKSSSAAFSNQFRMQIEPKDRKNFAFPLGFQDMIREMSKEKGASTGSISGTRIITTAEVWKAWLDLPQGQPIVLAPTSITASSTAPAFKLFGKKIDLGERQDTRRKAQEALFEMGFTWPEYETDFRRDIRYLLIQDNGIILPAWDSVSFDNSQFDEIHLEDLWEIVASRAESKPKAKPKTEAKPKLEVTEEEEAISELADPIMFYHDLDAKYKDQVKDIQSLISFFDGVRDNSKRGVLYKELSKVLKEGYDDLITQNAYVATGGSKNLITPKDLLNYYFTQTTQTPTIELGKACGLPTPNGKKSKLPLQTYFAVRSDFFKAWFGNWELAYELDDYSDCSLVIDVDTKEPRIMYHGVKEYTPDPNFHLTAMGLGVKRPYGSFEPPTFPATYFGDNLEYVKFYSGTSKNQPKPYPEYTGFVYKVFMNMRNPIRLDELGLRSTPKIVKDYLYARYGIEVDLPDSDNPIKVWNLTRRWANQLEIFKEMGYDGIVQIGDVPTFDKDGQIDIVNQIEDREYLTFYPNQLKSAMVKNSFYLPFMNDIRFAKGGKV